MDKTEVLIDTVFLHKLSSEGKEIGTLKQVLSELEFKPIVHPYIAKNELDMFPYVDKLVREEYIRIASYDEFLLDKSDKDIYCSYFQDIHDELRKYLDSTAGRKKLNILSLPKGQDIFGYRKAGMSLGDVHMILMASFMKIPVILSDDSDMDILRIIVKKKISYSEYELNILSCIEVLEKIALLKEKNVSKAELLKILKNIGENKNKHIINRAWETSLKCE